MSFQKFLRIRWIRVMNKKYKVSLDRVEGFPGGLVVENLLAMQETQV